MSAMILELVELDKTLTREEIVPVAAISARFGK